MCKVQVWQPRRSATSPSRYHSSRSDIARIFVVVLASLGAAAADPSPFGVTYEDAMALEATASEAARQHSVEHYDPGGHHHTFRHARAHEGAYPLDPSMPSRQPRRHPRRTAHRGAKTQAYHGPEYEFATPPTPPKQAHQPLTSMIEEDADEHDEDEQMQLHHHGRNHGRHHGAAATHVPYGTPRKLVRPTTELGFDGQRENALHASEQHDDEEDGLQEQETHAHDEVEEEEHEEQEEQEIEASAASHTDNGDEDQEASDDHICPNVNARCNGEDRCGNRLAPALHAGAPVVVRGEEVEMDVSGWATLERARKEDTAAGIPTARAGCVSKRMIFVNTDGARNTHMATIAATFRGGLLTAWQTAPHDEGDGGQDIVFSKSIDGGCQWTRPISVGMRTSPPPPPSFDNSHVASAGAARQWDDVNARGMQAKNKHELTGGPLWGPTFARAPGSKTVHMIYSQSISCRYLKNPNVWRPGGDVKMTWTDTEGDTWHYPPVTLLGEEQQVHVPKVTANPPAFVKVPQAANSRMWLLPYWGECPRGNKTECFGMCEAPKDEYAGVLQSGDDLYTWRAPGGAQLNDERTWLIEGSLSSVPASAAHMGHAHGGGRRLLRAWVESDEPSSGSDDGDQGDEDEHEHEHEHEHVHQHRHYRHHAATSAASSSHHSHHVRGAAGAAHPRGVRRSSSSEEPAPLHRSRQPPQPDPVVQVFRTSVNQLYRSVSVDAGRSWSTPEATSLPNPNSKVHLTTLPNGLLLLAYNHHKSRANTDGVRSYLSLATSSDLGKTWNTLAHLETETDPGFRFHYPTCMVGGEMMGEEDVPSGCEVLCVYTVSYRGYKGGHPPGREPGIRIAQVTLSLT